MGWLFRSSPGRGKPAKVPINPRTGDPASVDRPGTWAGFDEAVDAVHRYGLDGVGIVLGGPTRLVALDLDDAADPDTGRLDDWAAELVGRFGDTYAEYSPSGLGVRVMALGRLPAARRKRIGDLEVYTRARYVTITGDRLTGHPPTVRPTPAALRWLHDEFLRIDRRTWPGVTPRPVDRSDAELLARASGAADGAKFDRLWQGDTTGYRSASEADLALVNLLLYWTGGDLERSDRLLRSSGLFRPKWDSRRGASTYGRDTLVHAQATFRDFSARPAASGSGPGPRARRVSEGVPPPPWIQSVPLRFRFDRSGRADAARVDAAVYAAIVAERVRRGRPIGFGVRQLAEATGESQSAIGRSFKRLIASGALVLVSPGSRLDRRVAEYDLPGLGDSPA